MQRKEFECLRAEIEKQKLQIDCEVGPLEYAARRAAFRKSQLQRLIALARKVKGSKTVAAKVKRWERTMQKCEAARDSFLKHQERRKTASIQALPHLTAGVTPKGTQASERPRQ